jgi:hypothetical protein
MKTNRTSIGSLFAFLIAVLLTIPLVPVEDARASDSLTALGAHPDGSFPLSQLIVIVENSTLANAGTNSHFVVNLMRGNQRLYAFHTPRKSWQELQTGRTESYQWNLGSISQQTNINFESSMVTNSTICIMMDPANRNTDSWLPNRIWVMGRDANTGQVHLLAYASDWSSNQWFAADSIRRVYAMNLNQQACRTR